MKVGFVSLTSVPLQARAYLVSDWLSVVLWCDDSKPTKPGPQLMCITSHSQRIIQSLNLCASQVIHSVSFRASTYVHHKSFAAHIFMLGCPRQATHFWLHANNLVALQRARRHDASVRALSATQTCCLSAACTFKGATGPEAPKDVNNPAFKQSLCKPD